MLISMNDIAKQAHHGSVAAIIQVLNERLSSAGIRTRAVFVDGVLQLLCEAARVDQLEQPALVKQIQDILQAIAPRHIRRVNINSRIVREQQLLWLDEIKRDPEGQLLWSEEITLAKLSPLKQLGEHFARQTESEKPALPKPRPSRRSREKRQFWLGIVGGTSLCMFLVLVGWMIHAQSGSKPMSQTQAQLPRTVVTQADDPFVAAVRIAEQAATPGLVVHSSAEWLTLAARWQKASELMSSIPRSDKRYQTAQNRTLMYRKNSKAAQLEAEKIH